MLGLLVSPSRRSPAALADWRLFAGRFRKYAAVGVSQAAVTSLAGDSLTIPLLLALGTPGRGGDGDRGVAHRRVGRAARRPVAAPAG